MAIASLRSAKLYAADGSADIQAAPDMTWPFALLIVLFANKTPYPSPVGLYATIEACESARDAFQKEIAPMLQDPKNDLAAAIVECLSTRTIGQDS
jgi:hypothetical protein